MNHETEQKLCMNSDQNLHDLLCFYAHRVRVVVDRTRNFFLFLFNAGKKKFEKQQIRSYSNSKTKAEAGNQKSLISHATFLEHVRAWQSKIQADLISHGGGLHSSIHPC